jgi:hypothetical protein
MVGDPVVGDIVGPYLGPPSRAGVSRTGFGPPVIRPSLYLSGKALPGCLSVCELRAAVNEDIEPRGDVADPDCT